VPLGQMLAGRPGPVAPGGRDAVAGGDSLGMYAQYNFYVKFTNGGPNPSNCKFDQ